MKEQDIERLLKIGIALSAEKDYNRLLEEILSGAMSLTNCDAGTLYLKEGDYLVFRILRNDTMRTYQGGRGDAVTLPPVPVSGENVCALAVLLKKTINIEDVRNCAEYDLSGPLRYDAMTGYRTQSMLVVPMNNREGETTGVLQLINAKNAEGETAAFQEDMVPVAQSLAGQAAIALENMAYVEEIRRLLHSFVQVLASAIDERTPYNAAHTRNMARYGTSFLHYINKLHEEGKGELFFSERQEDEVLLSVWLHDIGKLVTPLEVMNKATRLGERLEIVLMRFEIIAAGIRNDFLSGRIDEKEREKRLALLEETERLIREADTAGFLRDETITALQEAAARTYLSAGGEERPWLTPEETECLTVRKGTLTEDERKIMEDHVKITSKLLKKIRFSREYEHVPEWASEHHEYLNGSGYPEHLKKEAIPVQVRIITILDIFDALTASDRPYKSGMPPERAVGILKEMAFKEGKLDGALTELFVESECWKREW